jgi:hypothetical protein
MKPYILSILSGVIITAANAQTGPNLSGIWSSEGTISPVWSGTIIGTNTSYDVAAGSPGDWDITARGRTQIGVATDFPPLTVLDIGTRARTTVTNSALIFDIDNRATVGNLNLNQLLGAGLPMAWSASYNVSGFSWESDDVLYTYTAQVYAPSGLLSNLISVANTFEFQVLDGSGQVIRSLSGGNLIDALGIQVLNGNLVDLPTNNIYTLSTTFLGGNYEDGITLSYNASSALTTSLLGTGDTILSISGLNIAAEAIPEPSSVMGTLLFGGLFALRRRR